MQDSSTGRDAQRRRTRERVLDAAIVEFKRTGTASADINAIVEAAGVARSTFYFHFPTKEHVLFELIGREEAQLVAELGRFLDTPHDLRSVLEVIVELVVALEGRWGPTLFRDVMSLQFSPIRPEGDLWTNHSTFVLLAGEILRAHNRGELYADVDAFQSAGFFLLGLYALLTTSRGPARERDDVLRKFVVSSLRGIQPEVPVSAAVNRSSR